MAVGSIKFKIDVDTKNVNSALKSAQGSLKDTASVAKSSSGVFSSIGNGLKSIGGAAVSAVGRVGKMAAAVTVFKAVNSAVGMVTGSIGSAISRIDTLNNSQRVFENMGFSAQESSAMMENLQKSIQGLPTGLDSAVQGVQLLAASTGDIGKSQELFAALNDGILGFGGSTEMVQNALVQLSQAFSNGKVDAETWNSMIDSGMGPALNALAKQMGLTTGELKKGLSDGSVSVETFQNALIDLDKNGGGGLKSLQQIAKDSTSGISTGLANMQTAITRGVAEVIKAFDGLLVDLTGMGISDWIADIGSKFETGLKDIAGGLGGFAEPIKGSFDTLKTVFDAIKGLAETTFKAITDAAGPISEKLGSVFKAAADFITDNMGTIESIVTTVVEVVTGVILGIGDTVEIVLPYFDSMVDIIGDVVAAIKDMLPEGTSLTDIVRKVTPYLIAAVAGFKLLKGGISLASGAFKTFNGVFEGINKFKNFTSAAKGGARALEKLSPAGKIAAKMFGKVGGAVKTMASVFGTAFKAIGTAVMAHPVIAAIVAIIAIIVLLWTKCEWFRDGVKAVWEAIKEAWSAGVEAIKQFFSDLGTTISEKWEEIKTTFMEVVTAIWEWLVETFNSICESVSQFIEEMKATIEFKITQIQEGWTAAWTAIKDFFVNLWNGIVDFVTGLWEGIKNVFTSAVTAIGDWLSNAWTTITTTVSNVWNGIKDFFSSLWEGIKTVFSTVVNWIVTFLQTMWNGIKNSTTIIWNVIKTVISTVWNTIKSVVSTVANTVKSIISTVWEAIKTFTSTSWNGIKTTISNTINAAKTIVSNIVNGIKTTVSNVFNSVKTTVTNIWNGIKTAITKPIEAAKNTVSGIIEKIKGLFNFKLKFPSVDIPHIKLPHFSMSGSINPLSGDFPPKVSIDWYATGGIFTGPSVIGVGEAGTEAVVPLSNKSRMAPFAKAVADFMKEDDSGKPAYSNRMPQKVTLEVPVVVNGRQFAKATVEDIETELDKRSSNKGRRGGKK